MKRLIVSLLVLFFISCSTSKELEPKVKVIKEKCKPEIIIKEKIVIKEKPVIEEKIVVKEKIVYKDKIVYRDKIVKEKVKKVAISTSKQIIGRVERINVVTINHTARAKIDTGAKTTSIDARKITRFERDGEKWVRFEFQGKKIEKAIVKDILIKRHGAKSQRRVVVKLRLKLGDVSRNVLVTLANRESFIYPILIGRNYLRDTFVVDVSKKYTIK